MARGPGREHDATRQKIIDGACEVIAQGSVDALSYRRVAAIAAVSAGRIQHYFPERDQLLTACFAEVQQRATLRIQERLEAAGSDEPLQLITAVLETMIPGSDAELQSLRMMALFESHALRHPHLQAQLQEGHARLRKLLIDQARLAVAKHRQDASAELVGSAVLALAEGLSNEVLQGQLTAVQAEHILHETLRELFKTPATPRKPADDEK